MLSYAITTWWPPLQDLATAKGLSPLSAGLSLKVIVLLDAPANMHFAFLFPTLFLLFFIAHLRRLNSDKEEGRRLSDGTIGQAH